MTILDQLNLLAYRWQARNQNGKSKNRKKAG
jgi:hypothetical protein